MKTTIRFHGVEYKLAEVGDWKSPKGLVLEMQKHPHELNNLITRFNKGFRLLQSGLTGAPEELRNRKSNKSIDYHFGPMFSRRDLALGNVLFYFGYEGGANHWLLNYYLAKKYRTLRKATGDELRLLEEQRDKWETARSRIVDSMRAIEPVLLQKAKEVAGEITAGDIKHLLDRFYNSKPEDAVNKKSWEKKV